MKYITLNIFLLSVLIVILLGLVYLYKNFIWALIVFFLFFTLILALAIEKYGVNLFVKYLRKNKPIDKNDLLKLVASAFALLTFNSRVGFALSLVISVCVFFYLFKLNIRFFFLAAIIFMIQSSIFSILAQSLLNNAAEQIAISSYYFLIIGSILLIIDLKKNS